MVTLGTIRVMSASTLELTPGDTLSLMTARRFVDGLNEFVELRFRGYHYVAIGDSDIAHPYELVSHPDGMTTVEPACGQGYTGKSAERLRPVGRPRKFCQRFGCLHAGSDRAAPSVDRDPAQLTLDLAV